MRAIILAAGQGKRMNIDKPKCLIEFGDITLLDRQLSMFQSFGIDNITVVAGYMANNLKTDSCAPYDRIMNEDYAHTNMVYSLFLADDVFMDDTIVSYGDIIYEKRVLKKVIKANKHINVAVDVNGVEYFKNRMGSYYKLSLESLSIVRNNRITDIGKKWHRLAKDSYDGQYIGLMKFTYKGWEMLSKIYYANKDKYKNAYMTDILNDMIKKGQHIYAVKTKGGWLEFDTQSDINTYEKWRKSGRLKKYYREEM